MSTSSRSRESVSHEFAGASFDDARLSARLVAVASAIAVAPERSLPRSMETKGQLEAAYRFFSNERVNLRRILEPHQEQTRERIAQAKLALMVHDTSTLEYEGDRDGLGPLGGAKHRGFLLHASLAVTADGLRQPLGVAAARTIVRSETKRPKRAGRSMPGSDYAKIEDKESRRWGEQIAETENLADGAALIHVMDGEGDAYPLLEMLRSKSYRFVVRAARDRRIDDEDAVRVSEACAGSRHIVELAVPVSSRKAETAPRAAKAHPPRTARVAHLAVAGLSVELKQPSYLGSDGTLAVNVVYVSEVKTPAGQTPLQWVIYTSEPVTKPQDALAVVEFYRTRWLIEEFFKALKTGCQIERLQLESYHSLTSALGVYLPIAWSILALRSISETHPDAPATDVLTATQIQVLRRFSHYKLKQHVTIRDAMLAVAALGGYIPHRVRPGWLVLSRGMEDLLRYELVWNAATEARDVGDR